MARFSFAGVFESLGWEVFSLNEEQIAAFSYDRSTTGHFIRLGNGLKLIIWGDLSSADRSDWVIRSIELSQRGDRIANIHQIEQAFLPFFRQSPEGIESFVQSGSDYFSLGDMNGFSTGRGDDWVSAGNEGFVRGGSGEDTISFSTSGLLALEVVDDGLLYRDHYGQELIFHGFEFIDTGHNVNALSAGTNGDDVLVGDSHPDELWDYIAGGDGGDTISAGRGHDYVDGGLGDDFLFGGIKDDTLIGGEGNDTLKGGRKRDFLWGADGDDLIQGGMHDDYAFGGTGSDTLIGGRGDDSLRGWEDADFLVGGFGRDTLEGGDGRDVYYGGAGRDLHRMGNGAETLIFGRADGRDGIQHFRIGQDVVQFGGLAETGSLAEFGFDDLELRQRGDHVVVRLEETRIYFYDRDLEDIAVVDHFVFL